MFKELGNNKFSEKDIRVYKIRWVILALFVASFFSSSIQWVQYTIIADTVTKYYGVTHEAVNWTAMIFLLTYAVFSLGGSYVLNALGLRSALLLGTLLSSIGAWIKMASLTPDRFWVVILGQAVVGVSQVFVTPTPSKLAATWFGSKEVSSACSIEIFGGQLGTAIGFLIPPLLVKNNLNRSAIEQGMYTMLMGTAVLNTVVLILIHIFFEDRPLSPPSLAQLEKEQIKEKSTSFTQSLKFLFSNSSYCLFILCFGINAGVYFAVSELLDEIILAYYPDGSSDAGTIGLVFTIIGMFGALVCGVILDRLDWFRETVIAVYALTFLSMLLFTFTIDKGIAIVYVTSGIVGFFMTGLFPAAYELTAELTYPIEETTSAGFLILLVQLFGIAFTYLYAGLLSKAGDKITNAIMAGLLGVGTVLLFCMRFELRRRAVQRQSEKLQAVVKTF